MSTGRRLATGVLLILAVAVILTFCDWFCHVRQDVLAYRDPDSGSLLPDQPTLGVFAGFVGLGVLFVAGGAMLFGQEEGVGWTRSLVFLAVFIALYYGTGLLQDDPIVITSVYPLIWLVLLWAAGLDLWRLVVFSVLLAVAGPLAEGIRADSGFFWYLQPDDFGVPLWLGSLYLCGAVALAALITTAFRTTRPSV
ncbi:MAG: hypothetical protein V9E83_14540 [Baekduia sp.]